MPEKQTILNQATTSPSILGARAGRKGVLAGVTAVMLFGMVAAFGTASNTVVYSGQISEVVEQLAAPIPNRSRLITTPIRANCAFSVAIRFPHC